MGCGPPLTHLQLPHVRRPLQLPPRSQDLGSSKRHFPTTVATQFRFLLKSGRSIMPAAKKKCGFLHTTVPVMYVCAPQRWCSRNLVVSRTVVCCGLGLEMPPRPHAMSRLTNRISAKGLIKIWILRINFIGHVCTCKNNKFNSFYLISHKI